MQNLRVDFGGVGAGEGLQDLAFSLEGGFDEDLFEGDAVVECFGGKFGGWRGAFGGKRLEVGGGENLLVEPNAAGLPLAGIDGFGGSLILRRYSGKVKLSANR